ncbi:alpha/beta hydrolase [Gordonia aichiensis]
MREQSHRLDVADVRYFAPAADGDSWYPRPFLEPIDANQPSLNHALDAIDARVDALVESGIDTARLVVWGFSQGACLLAHWALTRPQPVGGIILFTGGYIGPEDVVAQAQSLDGVPVVVRSIEHDPFVPPERVTQTVTALRAAGADVDALIVPVTSTSSPMRRSTLHGSCCVARRRCRSRSGHNTRRSAAHDLLPRSTFRLAAIGWSSLHRAGATGRDR